MWDDVRSGNWRETGFSLIELMIAVAVIGLLLAIAVPSYQEYLLRANRAAAKAVLLEISSRQAQYAASNRAFFSTPAANDLAALGMSVSDETVGKYDFTIITNTWCNPSTASSCPPLPTATDYLTVQVMQGYIATATPVAGSSQSSDGVLAINQYGLKTRTVSGAATAW